jgi:diguanylate cyclase (GGDEF)-like protein
MELAQDETELLLSIGNQIATAIENAQHYEEIETASLHDSLTGLANRRFLEIELEKNFESAKRYNEQLSAIMLDIDHFKEYNDSQGHIEGDKILVKLADILLRETRGPDRVFRYGGEEFLIILPQTDVAQACDVAERLRKMVEAEMEITISLGVAAYQDNMTDSERLVNCADFALYRAKREGRNRVVAVD